MRILRQHTIAPPRAGGRRTHDPKRCAPEGPIIRRIRSLQRLARLVACGFAIAAFGVGPLVASAQLLTPPATAPAANAPVPGVRVEGAFVTAPIAIDGATAFRLAVSAIGSPNQLGIGTRVSTVETAIAQLLAVVGSGAQAKTVYDPRSLRIHIRRDGEIASLEAVDATHADPLPVVTVTTLDGKYAGTGVDALATQWRDTLQGALTQALELRQPAFQRQSVVTVVELAVVLVVATLVVWWVLAAFARETASLASDVAARARAVRDAGTEGAADAAPEPHVRRRRTLALSLRAVEPARKLAIFRALSDTLLWATVLAWIAAIAWAFTLFPATTPLAQQIVESTFRVAITVVVTIVLNRIADAVIARTARAWQRRIASSNAETRARELLRIPTVATAVAGFKTFVVVFVALLAVLGEVGVPIGSVVTIGGLAAIALSLAAQNFVRDFVNGFLVLLEDQYAVGDFVTINAYSGLVERVTLRMVQVRDASGDLITVPHSSVASVVNQSRDWSRVDYRVPVDPAADVAAALAIVRGQIETLATDAAWREAFVEPIEWIGIDSMTRDAVVIRASVRTMPLRQFEIKRELNARVRATFATAGIGFGLPVV